MIQREKDFHQCNFFLHWHYSPLWALACRTMSFHFFLSATNSLHLLTPSTWSSLYTSSFYPFLGLPLLLIPSSSWAKFFLGILSSSILCRWPNQLILCPFIHFTIFSPLLISSSYRFVRLFHSLFSYLGPYILLNIFLSKISRTCSSFFVNVHASAPYDTTGLISVLYIIIVVALSSVQLVNVIIWHRVSTSEGHLQGSNTKRMKVIVYDCMKFWFEISVWHLDKVHVALWN